jgi:hypothetical protein
LSIWEFQRVVLNVPIVHIDLPEAGNLVIHMGLAKKTEGAVVPDFVIERQFRSGQKTNRDFGWTVMNYELGTVLPDGGKTTSARKFRRNQFIANLGGSRADIV